MVLKDQYVDAKDAAVIASIDFLPAIFSLALCRRYLHKNTEEIKLRRKVRANYIELACPMGGN